MRQRIVAVIGSGALLCGLLVVGATPAQAAKVTAVGSVTCGAPSTGKGTVNPPFRIAPAPGTRTVKWKLTLACRGTAGGGILPISASVKAVTTAPASQVCGGTLGTSALGKETAMSTVMDIKWAASGALKLAPSKVRFTTAAGPTQVPTGLEFPGPNGAATVTGSYAGNEASWWAPFASSYGDNCVFTKGLKKIATTSAMNLLITPARRAGGGQSWGSNIAGGLGDGGRTHPQWSPIQVPGGAVWAGVSPSVDVTCGVRNAGTLWCWGGGAAGPAQVGSDTTWAEVSKRCGRKTGGTIWCWTPSATPTPVQIGSDTDWSRISSSGLHHCAIKSTGTLWCWGNNDNGAIGDGSGVGQALPVQIGADSDWAGVSTGFWRSETSSFMTLRTCATRTGGTLWCWGDGSGPTPTQVGSDTNWAQVGVGGRRNCAVTTGATLKCWGADGIIGDGSTGFTPSPVQVGPAGVWAKAALGRETSCAIRTNGTLWCWGGNRDGQRGAGPQNGGLTPLPVGTATTWDSVDLFEYHSCGRRTDGTGWCWGSNSDFEMGGSFRRLTPGPISLASARTLSAGPQHACAVRSNRTLWCWGENDLGQLGDANTLLGIGAVSRPLPVQVALAAEIPQIPTSWRTVSAGGALTCATRVDGSLWCWGENDRGQRGGGFIGNNDYQAPTRVGTATGWVSVDAGQDHACAIKTDGSLWCWGAGNLRGNGGGADVSSPVRVGVANDWLAVTAGRDHSCALKLAGSLWCWGVNAAGQLGDGTTTTRLTPVRIGAATWTSVQARSSRNSLPVGTCGVRSDASLWCWGNNGSAQIGDGTTTNRLVPTHVGAAADWTAVAPGSIVTCGVRRPGSLWCWGSTLDGTLATNLAPVRVGTASTWSAVSGGWDFVLGLRT